LSSVWLPTTQFQKVMINVTKLEAIRYQWAFLCIVQNSIKFNMRVSFYESLTNFILIVLSLFMKKETAIAIILIPSQYDVSNIRNRLG